MKDYKYKPLSCEEVIAHIECRGYTRPPFAATPMLYKPSELQDEMKIAKAKQLLDIYPANYLFQK